jgi:hypothetical protein
MYQIFISPYLYEAQHVSRNTPPIIRSLKLHWQPRFCIHGRLLDALSDQQPHIQQPYTHAKPEVASAVLGS